MKNFKLKCILSAAAISYVAGFTLHATAGQMEETSVHSDAREVRTLSLQYAPADLATEEGRSNLNRRIAKAARDVCGPLDRLQAGGLGNMTRNRQCYKQAKQAAFSQIGFDQVVAIGH